MPSDDRDYKLKIFDFALTKSSVFSSILLSEVFGMFAILALLGLSGVSLYGKAILTAVYVGTVGAIFLTFSRIAYFTEVMKSVASELGFDETRERIESDTRNRLKAKKGVAAQSEWILFRTSTLFAERFSITIVAATIFAIFAWIAVIYHPA